VYQELFRLADSQAAGSVGAGAGVAFFRHSGLSDQELGNIWALADVARSGALEDAEFFIACKVRLLVSLHAFAHCSIVAHRDAPHRLRSSSPWHRVAYQCLPIICRRGRCCLTSGSCRGRRALQQAM